MKIYIMVSDDILFKPGLLYRVLQRRGHDVCGVAGVGYQKTKRSKDLDLPTRIQYWGVKGFFFLKVCGFFLRALQFVPLPSFIKCKLSNKNVCSFFNVQYEQIDDVNDPGFLSRLSSLEPDIIVSSQTQIFSESLLRIAKIACLNCHPAKLPKYRGLNPVFAAMMDREETIGATVHTMTMKIDKGAIVCQKEFRTSKEYTLMDNYSLVHQLFADMIIESLDLLEKKSVSDFPMVSDEIPYCKRPSLEEIRKFRASGFKII